MITVKALTCKWCGKELKRTEHLECLHCETMRGEVEANPQLFLKILASSHDPYRIYAAQWLASLGFELNGLEVKTNMLCTLLNLYCQVADTVEINLKDEGERWKSTVSHKGTHLDTIYAMTRIEVVSGSLMWIEKSDYNRMRIVIR